MADLLASIDCRDHDSFASRHIGPRDADRLAMLSFLELRSIEDLIGRVVPEGILSGDPLQLGSGRSEAEVLVALRARAAKNRIFKSFIGMGYYGCHTPTVLLRNVLENPAWYTAYTPYQPEISQGRLEALLAFQTMVADLTGLPVANASLLDEGTAAAEAMTLCKRASRSSSDTFLVSADCHPQTINVVRTRAQPIGLKVLVDDPARILERTDCFGVLLQYPASTGEVHDYQELVSLAHSRKALVAVAADILALTLLRPPGEFGADIAIGSTQRFGVPMGCGGPHAAYMAVREEMKRMMPGRIVGLSVDTKGRPAYRLALQTREQHIRREKATSNICTAQALLAIMAAMYAAYHGPLGLTAIARRVHRLTATFVAGLRLQGLDVLQTAFFDTVTVNTGARTVDVLRAAQQREMNLRILGARSIGVSFDETTTPADVEALWEVIGNQRAPLAFDDVVKGVTEAIPRLLRRKSAFLSHPIFNSHQSETEMLRYLRSLADKDLALDRTMIPLGSCTMKLNATTELIPITWSEFANVHPFAPADQLEGYRQLVKELEDMLCACTGYDAVSVQPNAGSQGEYAGLLAIRAYHESRGQGKRDVCLIPSSAHGTNPATAQMAGMRVVVVNCDSTGSVDLQDLVARCEQHAEKIGAIMITYPSTHGVFEPAVRKICDVVHKYGGQVYIDGANMNAMVGLCQPGHFGGDVSHLNLHKTFCIPHGGGGPGVGPIGVKSHLAPFLPGHSHDGTGAVSSAPWGSAGILPISWAYISLMGAGGLREASVVAILNANYLARRLAPHFPVLYTGEHGMVAHECILDLRPTTEATGITVDDVAKRLIDFGFHAPTMSFPVPGTLMIEPTESESLAELDRFCSAMIAIRSEIIAIERGAADRTDNPLKNAPHTALDLLGDWPHSYTRLEGAFGAEGPWPNKYWPPVSRVDSVYGDRNLVCTCPPLASYAEVDQEAESTCT